jgi:hypothetical protein
VGDDPLLAQAAPAAPPAFDAAPETAAAKKKRTKRGDKRERRQDGRGRERQRRKAESPPRPRQRIEAEVEADTGPTRREMERDWREKCDAPGSIELPQSKLCTHGPDPVPPGVDVTDPVEPLPPAMARAAGEELTCDGDGQSGPRVQVLYARGSNVPSRHTAFLASFRAWALDVDAVFQESAAAAGGARRVRFVTSPGCQIDVPEAVLSPAGDDSFDAMAAELKAQGFNRTNRKYLVFLDAPATFACGEGSRWDDDDPGQTNWNNYGPSFARVFNDCWDGGHTPQHELMHTLGGVQDSAPNASLGGHCIDEYDVMCYSDDPFRPTMRYDCLEEMLEDWFDCNHNDYYHPNPSAGSYLATHWNAANSRFLVGGGNGSDENGASPTVTWISPVANAGIHEVTAGTVQLQADAADDAGINRVDFWRFDSDSEQWIKIATDRSAPFTASVDVADLPLGFNQVNADAYDGAMNRDSEHIWLRKQEPSPQPPEVNWVSPVGNEGVHRVSTGSVALEATATDDGGIAEVIFARYDEPQDEWITIATDDSAPYTANLAVSDLNMGANWVTANGYDAAGNQGWQGIWIERIEPPPAVAITSPQSGARVKAGAAVIIAIAVAEPAGATVEVRSCPGSSCSWAAGTSLGSDSSAPFGVGWTAPASGTVTFLAQVSAGAGPKLSEPVTVSVEKAKAKKKKKGKKKKKKR